jgi:CYTH domain-containing protein
MLNKVRYSVPPLGIDVFEGTLEGLRLAEAEFNSPRKLMPLSFLTLSATR